TEALRPLPHETTGFEPTELGAKPRAGEVEHRRKWCAVVQPRCRFHHVRKATAATVGDSAHPAWRATQLPAYGLEVGISRATLGVLAVLGHVVHGHLSGWAGSVAAPAPSTLCHSVCHQAGG